MFSRETPSSVLFNDLHDFGGMSNKEAASYLLSSQVMAGGRSPKDRIQSRTYLSRKVVHVAPSDVNPSIFGDLFASSQTLYARVLSNTSTGTDSNAVRNHYLGPAAMAMTHALAAYGLDDGIYRNELLRLERVHLRSERERPLLIFMLFCITGCLANAYEAVSKVEQFATNKLAQDLSTATAYELAEDDPLRNTSLGLLRMRGEVAQPPVHTLRREGSVVGSLASGPGAITDVGPDVSRAHLQLWHDGTRWLCQGMGSTNGTFIIRGSDNTRVFVEPPRSLRTQRTNTPPQAFYAGDRICCGQSTTFLVLRVDARHEA